MTGKYTRNGLEERTLAWGLVIGLQYLAILSFRKDSKGEWILKASIKRDIFQVPYIYL